MQARHQMLRLPLFTLLAGCLLAPAPKPKKSPTVLRTLFHTACTGVARAAANLGCRFSILAPLPESLVVRLAIARTPLFIWNTVMVAALISLIEGKSLGSIWQNCRLWICPVYWVGAALARLMTAACSAANWPASMLVLPTITMVSVWYSAHINQKESATWGG